MSQFTPGRRHFIRKSATAASAIISLPWLPKAFAGENNKTTRSVYEKPRIRFSVIGVNHGHIHSQVGTITRGGGELVSFYAGEPDLAAAFAKDHPQATPAKSKEEILNDPSVQLILSAAIPDERALIAMEAMRHGKDFMSDKPGVTTLEQLAQVRRVQKETNRIYSIFYGRLETQSTIRAAQLVKEGAIGKVIQTIGMGPHRMNPASRPDWFFDKKRYGGILTDLASHQCDYFLYFTGSTFAEVVASQTGNFNHPQYPGIEDFGDAMVNGNGGTGYMRVDWLTPDGLKTWGDSRLTILGTEGYMEIRMNIDLAGRQGDNHLFLVNNKETKYIRSDDVALEYGSKLVDDIIHRTETAMSQAHCFLATELSLKIQEQAKNIS